MRNGWILTGNAQEPVLSMLKPANDTSVMGHCSDVQWKEVSRVSVMDTVGATCCRCLLIL